MHHYESALINASRVSNNYNEIIVLIVSAKTSGLICIQYSVDKHYIIIIICWYSTYVNIAQVYLAKPNTFSKTNEAVKKLIVVILQSIFTAHTPKWLM